MLCFSRLHMCSSNHPIETVVQLWCIRVAQKGVLVAHQCGQRHSISVKRAESVHNCLGGFIIPAKQNRHRSKNNIVDPRDDAFRCLRNHMRATPHRSQRPICKRQIIGGKSSECKDRRSEWFVLFFDRAPSFVGAQTHRKTSPFTPPCSAVESSMSQGGPPTMDPTGALPRSPKFAFRLSCSNCPLIFFQSFNGLLRWLYPTMLRLSSTCGAATWSTLVASTCARKHAH